MLATRNSVIASVSILCGYKEVYNDLINLQYVDITENRSVKVCIMKGYYLLNHYW